MVSHYRSNYIFLVYNSSITANMQAVKVISLGHGISMKWSYGDVEYKVPRNPLLSAIL